MWALHTLVTMYIFKFYLGLKVCAERMMYLVSSVAN